MRIFQKIKKESKKIKKTDLGIAAIIIIGIIAVVNFFSYQIFYRWDLTQNKDYSISRVSKKSVGQLDDIVNIKVYFSKDLPSQYVTLPQEVGDILDEYANYSNGNIKYEFIDPKDDEKVARKLAMMGIPELQFNVLEKDKLQVVRGYLGMVIEYGSKNEAIPVVDSTTNLEYQVTLAIKKMTSEEMATVGFITSNATADLNTEATTAYRKLLELYQVRFVDLSTAEEVPSEINTLIIMGPRDKFEENQLKAIDAFLMGGKSLLVLLDGVKIGEGLIPSVNNSELSGLLESYGIKLNNDLVLDVSSGMASFSQGFFTFSTNYPFWPKIIKNGFDQDNAAVSKLENVIFPWTSSLEILSNKIDESNNISYLARTTENAWLQTENFDLNPQSQTFGAAGNKNQYTIAVSVSGKFNSAYGNGSTETGHLIVVGDSDFIKDEFAGQTQNNNSNNLVFFQNLVDSLSLDEDLINIRSKGISNRPIKELSDGQRVTVRYLNIFSVTLVVLLFGMIRYFIRRRKGFTDEL